MKIFLFLLLTNFCIAQNNKLIVTYGLVFQDDELLSDNSSVFKVHLDYAIANPNRFLFDLNIDDKGYLFELKNKLSTSEKNLSDDMAFIFAKYPGLIFSVNGEILKQSSLLGNKVFVKSEMINGWKLTEESKKIDGFLCYKATNVDRVVNDIKVFEHPIIAWYCPELPYNYGPIGYGNLPGLILELQVRNTVYGALKLDFNSEKLPDYDILKKSEIISKEEEKKRLKVFFQN